jgi:hypothetical protein
MSLASSSFFAFLGLSIPIFGFVLPRLRHSSWPWDIQTTVDPRVAPTPAPIGTSCRNTLTGDLFMKIGPGPTDWRLLSTEALFPVQPGLIVGDFAVTMAVINQIDATQAGTVNANLPAANSVPNGAWTILAVHPASGPLTALNVNPDGADTINFTAGPLSFAFAGNQLTTILSSDGDSNWTEISRVYV